MKSENTGIGAAFDTLFDQSAEIKRLQEMEKQFKALYDAAETIGPHSDNKKWDKLVEALRQAENVFGGGDE